MWRLHEAAREGIDVGQGEDLLEAVRLQRPATGRLLVVARGARVAHGQGGGEGALEGPGIGSVVATIRHEEQRNESNCRESSST